ncbi:MAG: hypothetical protein ACTS77_01340 [Arsenophonus sp. NC-TX2-MAG3]
MVRIKVASDNGDNLINKLQLIYNKTHQTRLIKELTEIVSVAAAV